MATVNIKGKSGLLMIFFRIYPLLVSINGGEPQRIQWGGSAVPVPAGNVDVQVFYKFYWFIPANRATTSLDLGPDQSATLVYKPSYLLFFVSGRLTAA